MSSISDITTSTTIKTQRRSFFRRIIGFKSNRTTANPASTKNNWGAGVQDAVEKAVAKELPKEINKLKKRIDEQQKQRNKFTQDLEGPRLKVLLEGSWNNFRANRLGSRIEKNQEKLQKKQDHLNKENTKFVLYERNDPEGYFNP